MYYAQLYSTRNPKVMRKARKEMVCYALHHGNRAAARKYECTRNTVKLWLERYMEDPQRELIDRRPPTTNHPDKMEKEYEERLCNAVRKRKERGQRIIVAHLQKELCIPYSLKTCIKLLRRHGLYKDRHSKKTQKRDLRIVTDRLRFGQQIQVDIKYLTDIPELKGSMYYKYIPKYQLTARDRATGALWYGYSDTRNTTDTALFIERLMTHLYTHGVDLSQVAFQTDNGKEFTTWYDSPRATLFEKVIAWGGANHYTIPMKSPTSNSTVEASHRLIEDECYGNMYLPSTEEFFRAVTNYQEHFNFTRHNAYRKGSPYMLLVKKAPEIDHAVLFLAPVRVDKLLTKERLMAWRSLQDTVP